MWMTYCQLDSKVLNIKTNKYAYETKCGNQMLLFVCLFFYMLIETTFQYFPPSISFFLFVFFTYVKGIAAATSFEVVSEG